MNNKLLLKSISIILLLAFLWQEVGLARMDCFLRPLAATEKNAEQEQLSKLNSLIKQRFGASFAKTFFNSFTRWLEEAVSYGLPAENHKMALGAAIWIFENPNNYEIVRKLADRVNRFAKIWDLNGPGSVLRDETGLIWKVLTTGLTANQLYSLYGNEIKSFDELPRYDLLPEAPYSEWASQILLHDSEDFLRLMRLRDEWRSSPSDGEAPTATSICASFLYGLPPPSKRRAAQAILDRLNEGRLPKPIDDDFMCLYYAVIYSFDERVGLLTNTETAEEIYNYILHDYGAEVVEWDLDMLEHGYEEVTMDNGEAEEEISIYDSLDDDADPLFTFINYNPGPELLKRVVKAMDMSDTQTNALLWLVKSIPKRGGRSRDRRRQVHRYLVRLTEYRLRDAYGDVKDVLNFMGSCIAYIDTRIVDKQEVENILDFMLNFSNLSRKMQERVARETAPLLNQWRAEAGRKLFMRGTHFIELTRRIDEAMVNYLLDNSITLASSEKARLRAHISKYPEAWNEQGFWHILASYHGFQDMEGRKKTEEFLRQLMRARVQDGRFVGIRRYAQVRDTFGPALAHKLKKGVRREFEISAGGETLSGIFAGIREDIFAHLGISGEEYLAAEVTGDWAAMLGVAKDEIPEEEMEVINGTISEVIERLEAAEPISYGTVQGWKERLLPSRAEKRPVWFNKRPQWREILVNLDQITQVQSVDFANIKRFIFEITDDPVAFVLSGTEPYETCQRCTEPTGFNKKGRPINRVRQGQFLLARIIAEKQDGSKEVVLRSHLEIARKMSVEDALSALKPRKLTRGKLPPALLVERVYHKGVVPMRVFQDRILGWAGEDEEIGCVVFAGSPPPKQFAERAPIQFLPSDGEIYRDTFHEGWWKAFRMEKFRAYKPQPQSHPQRLQDDIEGAV